MLGNGHDSSGRQKNYINIVQKAQGITIRRLQFNPKAIRRHYFANSPGHVAFTDGIVFDFPIGEQFLCIVCAMYVTK